MITITINGKDIQLDEPLTVLEAARRTGIKIPTLCDHELLDPHGGCRLCVVEVERMPKLQNSCTLLAADGMVIRTESDEIAKVRRGMLELLLINHPLDCPYCDKAGECELQDLVDKYGHTSGKYTEEKRKVPESHEDHILTRHMGRCVVCTRCVRMCSSVQGASAISIVGRGNRSRMEPFSSQSFNCEYCGNCLSVCPVGAILSRLYIHSFRPWQIDREVETVCSYCGVGCTLVVQVRDNSIKRVVPKFGYGVNRGLLCSRGRFGYEYIESNDRLQTPLIRRNGRLEQSSWNEAFEFVAKKLREVRESSGGESIAGIASPRCTNEDSYIFQKFMRMACRTNNIDSVSRTGFAAAQKYFQNLLGQGVTSNMIEGIKNSDTILVIGGDPTSVNPILGLAIRGAAREGARIAIVGHARGLERFRTLRVSPSAFNESGALELLLTKIVKTKGQRGEKEALDKRITGLLDSVDGENEEIDALAKMLLDGESVAIVMGTDLVQRSDGHRGLFAVAGLTYLLEARLFLLSEKPNEQGLIDMGCVPDMLPGERPLHIGNFKQVVEEIWKGSIPEEKGLTLMEIIDAIRKKEIRALYITGENPVFNLPDSTSVKEALQSLDLLVVQDIFLGETAELADVVFPALGWTEKEGTYTNLERRVQLLRKARESSSGLEDWKIFSEISKKMGYQMNYPGPKAIMGEIAEVSPLYRDLTYEEIRKGNCLWPYHGEPLRGELREVPVAEVSSRDFTGEFYLVPDKLLFHSGTTSRKSQALNKICSGPVLSIGRHHAGKLEVEEGDRVHVSTEKGTLEVNVTIDSTIQDSRVFLSNNFEGAGVFSLLNYSIDPVTKAPGIEGCEVTITKAQEGKA
ncbi:2Fe-2S iron-sulfur cluster binding domain-containing protein [bacterium]|nr:MAG: 2Fe-2S iron-sulfur cluster binding domain-containing protein [bacterium]